MSVFKAILTCHVLDPLVWVSEASHCCQQETNRMKEEVLVWRGDLQVKTVTENQSERSLPLCWKSHFILRRIDQSEPSLFIKDLCCLYMLQMAVCIFLLNTRGQHFSHIQLTSLIQSGDGKGEGLCSDWLLSVTHCWAFVCSGPFHFRPLLNVSMMSFRGGAFAEGGMRGG